MGLHNSWVVRSTLVVKVGVCIYKTRTGVDDNLLNGLIGVKNELGLLHLDAFFALVLSAAQCSVTCMACLGGCAGADDKWDGLTV